MLKVTSDALDFALNHIERYGDTDIFLAAFEFEAIRWAWEEARDYLIEQDLDEWVVRPLRQYLSPKGKLGYRIATQLDPLDTLLLTALVYEVGNNIEQARIPSSDNVVLSYRFAPDDNGRLYSKDFSYDAFRRQSLKLANEIHDGWVVLTDISDFYLRLYLHPIENALTPVVPSDHARVIIKLIKQWNLRVSYGIPVGPSATRLLAELTINDVDSLLLDHQIIYCRYSDDFRLFAPTKSQAYKQLGLLADVLYNNHGLTLQEAKTEVISSAQFVQRFRETDAQKTLASLEKNFYNLVDLLGINSYDEIEYNDLNHDQKRAINELNLLQIIDEQIAREKVDTALMGFVLRRIIHMGEVTIELALLLLSRIDNLVPVFKEVIAVVKAVLNMKESLNSSKRREIIDSIIELLEHPFLSHIEYYSAWLFTLFEDEYNAQFVELPSLYASHSGILTKRELILAMGFTNQAWIRNHKRKLFEFTDWDRRAFLRAASCLPFDEAKHWFRSIDNRIDVLDRWVAIWAKKNPIGSGLNQARN